MTKKKPNNFDTRFDIVGCFLKYDGKFLLLHRHAHKSQGNTWGLPAGKMESHETQTQAILREIQEETGLTISETSLQYCDSWYVRDGDFDIQWHVFSIVLDTQPMINIHSYEHSEYCWVTPEEALHMNLIHDLSETIKLQYLL